MNLETTFQSSVADDRKQHFMAVSMSPSSAQSLELLNGSPSNALQWSFDEYSFAVETCANSAALEKSNVPMDFLLNFQCKLVLGNSDFRTPLKLELHAVDS
jgi:hypothetical protein